MSQYWSRRSIRCGWSRGAWRLRLRGLERTGSGEWVGKTAVSQQLERFFCLLQPREYLLRFPKFPRVAPAARAAVVDRITQVQHFVEHDVLQGRRRRKRPVEDAANNDRIVRGIKMPQHAARSAAAPAQQRPPQ